MSVRSSAALSPVRLAQLEAGLADEALELESLIHATEREHAAIAGGLADELTRLAREKEMRATRISELATRRRALLATLLPDDGTEGGAEGGMAGLVGGLPAASPLPQAWRRVQSRASQAEQLNRSSGILLRLHSAQLRARIAAFMGATRPASGTYGSDGNVALQGSRALGAA